MLENMAPLLETEEAKQLEIEQRQAIANEWLEAAEEVALNSGLDLALEVADFLKTRIGLGIANRPGYLMIFYHLRPELKVSDFAFITPVLAIDNHYVANHRTDSGQFINNDGAEIIASFREQDRTIVFNGDLELSRVGKGLVLLHEAVHAITAIDIAINRSVYPNQYWLEEAEALQFEYQILAGLGGEAYTELVKRIEAEIVEDEDGTDCSYQFSEPDFQILKAIFGQQASEDELENWANLITSNGWFEYFKRHHAQPIVKFADYLLWRASDL